MIGVVGDERTWERKTYSKKNLPQIPKFLKMKVLRNIVWLMKTKQYKQMCPSTL